MSHRFFSSEPLDTDRVTIGGTEAHHMLHVMRLSVGDTVIVFDGSGVECTAALRGTSRSEVELQITGRNHVDRELGFELTIGIALPKGDRQRWLVEKCVELGVTRIVPMVSDRSVAQPRPQALERLRRTVIETSKQCGRNRLLQISEPLGFAEFISGAPGIAQRLIAHPASQSETSARPRPASSFIKKIETVIAIGPEGGFTDDEIELAKETFESVDLGSRTLRIETAAVALASLLSL